MEDILNYGSGMFEYGFVVFLISAAIGYALAKVVTRIITRSVNRALEHSDTKRATSIGYFTQIVNFVIYFIVAMTVLAQVKALSGLGKTLLGASGVVAVVLSLAAQETFGNFISGFFLAVTQPFIVGDRIEIMGEDIDGIVEEINFRHTVIRTRENHRTIVPNSVINSAIVKDKTGPSTPYIYTVTVGVAYDTDIALLKKVITDVVTKQHHYVDLRTDEQKHRKEPAVQIRLDDFLDSAIEVTIVCACKDPLTSKMDASHIREQLLSSFKENGIEIPYPHITVTK